MYYFYRNRRQISILPNGAPPSGPQYQQAQSGNLTIQLQPQSVSKKSTQAPLSQQQLAQAQLPQPSLLKQKKKKKVSPKKHTKVKKQVKAKEHVKTSPKKHVKGVSRDALSPADQAAKDKYEAQNQKISFRMRIPESGKVGEEKLIIKSPDYLEGKCSWYHFICFCH